MVKSHQIRFIFDIRTPDLSTPRIIDVCITILGSSRRMGIDPVSRCLKAETTTSWFPAVIIMSLWHNYDQFPLSSIGHPALCNIQLSVFAYFPNRFSMKLDVPLPVVQIPMGHIPKRELTVTVTSASIDLLNAILGIILSEYRLSQEKVSTGIGYE